MKLYSVTVDWENSLTGSQRNRVMLILAATKKDAEKAILEYYVIEPPTDIDIVVRATPYTGKLEARVIARLHVPEDVSKPIEWRFI